MGMDLYTVKRCGADLSVEGRSLILPMCYLDAYNAKFPGDVINVIRDVSYDTFQKLQGTAHPDKPKYILNGFDEGGNVVYSKAKHIRKYDKIYDAYVNCSNGVRDKIAKQFKKINKKLTTKSITFPTPDEYKSDIHFVTGYLFQDVGYIRKPFRQDSEVESTLDWDEYSKLLGNGTESSAAIFDVKVARQLKVYAGDKVNWQKQVVNLMRSKDVFVVMDW